MDLFLIEIIGPGQAGYPVILRAYTYRAGGPDSARAEAQRAMDGTEGATGAYVWSLHVKLVKAKAH